MNLIGEVINGMKIVGDPIRSGVRGSNYKYPCDCVLCGKHKVLTLQSLRERKVPGCGCAIDGKITKNGISFYQWCVDNNREDLLFLWDDELNNVSPQQISSQSQKKRWFRCERGIHESFLYSIPSLTRRQNHECFCEKCNSFAQHFIDRFGEEEFDLIWDYQDNQIDLWVLQYGSDQPVFANCINDELHPPYETTPNALMRGRRCPECAKHMKSSKLQKLIERYIGHNYDFILNHEYDCELKCISPRTHYQLPYDNELFVNGNGLIIEVHGEQHYGLNSWHTAIARKLNVSPEQIFQDQQWRDNFKKEYALSKGWEYLIIPYWAKDDETYKSMIDLKIQNILSQT